VITIRHLETGERQFVASLDGIDLEVWEETAEPVPADLAARAWVVVDGELQPAPRSMPVIDFLLLWTPAETLAVMQTTSPMMAVAWSQTLASPRINLSDERVIAGAELAVSLGILTEARAARILAGLAPEPG
jgi:hypothetical protein